MSKPTFPSDLNAKLLGGNDFEVTNNRIKNALVALERLVDGKVQMIQDGEQGTDRAVPKKGRRTPKLRSTPNT